MPADPHAGAGWHHPAHSCSCGRLLYVFVDASPTGLGSFVVLIDYFLEVSLGRVGFWPHDVCVCDDVGLLLCGSTSDCDVAAALCRFDVDRLRWQDLPVDQDRYCTVQYLSYVQAERKCRVHRVRPGNDDDDEDDGEDFVEEFEVDAV